MNLAEQGRLLYVSMADVSQPNGPGVNEREFLLSLYQRLGDRMHALLPQPRRACDELDPARTTLYRNPHRWNLPGFLLQQVELYRHVRRLVAAERFDLVVVRLSVIPLAFYFLRGMKTPFVVKTLGEVQGLKRNHGLKGLAAKALLPLNFFLFRKIVARAAAVDACTPQLMQLHERNFGLTSERLFLVENATSATRFAPEDALAAKRRLGLTRFEPVLGYVGGVPAERGGMQLLELAARLQTDFPYLGVVIVGDDKAGALKRRAQELGVAERLASPGVIPYEAVAGYINCFDVGVALDDPARTRASGNSYQKVRQYLACGKAVVTSMDASSELVQEGLVENAPADDLDALEAAVRQLLGRDDHARGRHATRAARFVRERLSTQYTLERRLEFWGRRLAEIRGEAGRRATPPERPPVTRAG